MAFPFIAAAAGIGANLLGDALDRSAAKKQQEQAIKAMKALLIPAQETARRADMYGDDLYTRTMGDVNAGAFHAAAALNPETLRTIAFSKMATARSQTETAVKEEDYRYNKQVQQQIAGIAAQPLPTIDVTGALGAGVAGYFGGRQLEMSASLLGMQEKYFDMLGKDVGQYGMGIGVFNPTTRANIMSMGKPEEIDVWTGLPKKK